jgi:chromosome segregation protein
MRGGEMDDVIFSGTAQRTSRNIAEVSMLVDNSERRAPAMFNDSEELEVSRRIERGSGSTYRVNGREVRARDVQLLFADAASGARSTALVSQGRIGQLIRDKPTDRRALLEEAAGITGLHSRRHEAELRLRAAETNLERLEDVMGTLETQLQGLKRQARQATRYRNVSRDIRRAEALNLHLRWTAAREQAVAARSALDDAEARVTELTRQAAQASRAQAEAAQALPPLRDEEATAAARLHSLAVARDGLEKEEARLREDQNRLADHLEQTDQAITREHSLAEEAIEADQRLAGELQKLEVRQDGIEESRRIAAETVEEARASVSDLEARLDSLQREIAELVARRKALFERRETASGRIAAVEAKLQRTAAERDVLESEETEARATREASAQVATAREMAAAARDGAEQAEAARRAAQDAESVAREALQSKETGLARLRAEVETLAEVLDLADDELWPPLIDAVTVEPGYEAALGAALGDDLAKPADEAAPVHWRTLSLAGAPPPLPAGSRPLSDFVQAPAELASRLAQVGVVEEHEGPRAVHELVQGQRLVTRAGGLWRWDGFTIAAGARNAAAVRLAERNRYRELHDRLSG